MTINCFSERILTLLQNQESRKDDDNLLLMTIASKMDIQGQRLKSVEEEVKRNTVKLHDQQRELRHLNETLREQGQKLEGIQSEVSRVRESLSATEDVNVTRQAGSGATVKETGDVTDLVLQFKNVVTETLVGHEKVQSQRHVETFSKLAHSVESLIKSHSKRHKEIMSTLEAVANCKKTHVKWHRDTMAKLEGVTGMIYR